MGGCEHDNRLARLGQTARRGGSNAGMGTLQSAHLGLQPDEFGSRFHRTNGYSTQPHAPQRSLDPVRQQHVARLGELVIEA